MKALMSEVIHVGVVKLQRERERRLEVISDMIQCRSQ